MHLQKWFLEPNTLDRETNQEVIWCTHKLIIEQQSNRSIKLIIKLQRISWEHLKRLATEWGSKDRSEVFMGWVLYNQVSNDIVKNECGLLINHKSIKFGYEALLVQYLCYNDHTSDHTAWNNNLWRFPKYFPANMRLHFLEQWWLNQDNLCELEQSHKVETIQPKCLLDNILVKLWIEHDYVIPELIHLILQCHVLFLYVGHSVLRHIEFRPIDEVPMLLQQCDYTSE